MTERPTKVSRIRTSSDSPVGSCPTPKERALLRIFARHCWCTMELVRRFAECYGIRARGNSVADAVRRLIENGYIRDVATHDGRKTRAFALTKRGISYLMSVHPGDVGLRLVSNRPRKIIAMNRAILELNDRMPASFWILGANLAVENEKLPSPRFNFAYDAIAGFPIDNGWVRVGFIVDLRPLSAAEYRQLCSRLASEKLLHLIVFLVEDESLHRFHSQFSPILDRIAVLKMARRTEPSAQPRAWLWQEDLLSGSSLAEVMKVFAATRLPEFFTLSSFTLTPRDNQLGALLQVGAL